jgi:hypothetical protein
VTVEAADAVDADENRPRRHPATRVAIWAAASLLAAAAVAGLTAWTRSGPPSPSPTDAWSGWTAKFAPVLGNFSSDVVSASRDLSRADRTAARADFGRLATDIALMGSLATSIDPTVNTDVRRVTSDVSQAWHDALDHWPAIDLARFDAAINAYISDSRDLTTAILAENARYGTG